MVERQTLYIAVGVVVVVLISWGLNEIPSSDSESDYKYEWLNKLCGIIGWIYFWAWSVSFYPQTILNFRRKSVIGLSFDYQLYNFTGFLLYSIYNISSYVHDMNKDNNPIAINDIAFAVHAFILTCVTVAQICIFERGTQRVSRFAMLFAGVLWLITIYNIILSIATGYMPWFGGSFSTVTWMGDVKVAVSCVKYIPQAYMNFRDKSTTGWSIHNVLLDFTGGSLSILQQILSGYNTGDWSFVTGNIPKFLLGTESIIFDIIFMIQHYVLYGDNESIHRRPPKPDDTSFDNRHSFDYARTKDTSISDTNRDITDAFESRSSPKQTQAPRAIVPVTTAAQHGKQASSLSKYDVIIKMDQNDNNPQQTTLASPHAAKDSMQINYQSSDTSQSISDATSTNTVRIKHASVTSTDARAKDSLLDRTDRSDRAQEESTLNDAEQSELKQSEYVTPAGTNGKDGIDTIGAMIERDAANSTDRADMMNLGDFGSFNNFAARGTVDTVGSVVASAASAGGQGMRASNISNASNPFDVSLANVSISSMTMDSMRAGPESEWMEGKKVSNAKMNDIEGVAAGVGSQSSASRGFQRDAENEPFAAYAAIADNAEQANYNNNNNNNNNVASQIQPLLHKK